MVMILKQVISSFSSCIYTQHIHLLYFNRNGITLIAHFSLWLNFLSSEEFFHTITDYLIYFDNCIKLFILWIDGCLYSRFCVLFWGFFFANNFSVNIKCTESRRIHRSGILCPRNTHFNFWGTDKSPFRETCLARFLPTMLRMFLPDIIFALILICFFRLASLLGEHSLLLS